VKLAQDAFERSLGRRPLLLRSGGTLPIVPALADRGIPTVLSGFDVPEGNVHSPNERLLLRYLPLGTDAAREMFLRFAELP
jgi:acetylornithine deacetylase/succinyl-diaminopimelate desuccinylase-like protein